MTAIDKTAASLRFFGDELDPDNVTMLLGHPPSVGVRKGGTWTTARGVEKVSPRGSWRLKASDRRPGDLDGQIEEILGLLSDDLSVWQELTTRFSADVFCGLFMRDSNEGLGLSAATLKKLGSRSLVLNLDIYDKGTPED